MVNAFGQNGDDDDEDLWLNVNSSVYVYICQNNCQYVLGMSIYNIL